MLTLTVTAGNIPAIHLYESSGFVAYGSLPRALKIGNVYHDKLHMAFTL
jgi:RimJ/RimL family protein N-acetyltransferase